MNYIKWFVFFFLLLLLFCKKQKELPVIEPNKVSNSVARNSLVMFRGNQYHTFYGKGKIPRKVKLLWKFKTGQILEGEKEKRGVDPNTIWKGVAWSGQPAIIGDTLVFGSCDSYLYCLNKNNGELIWKYKCGHSIKSSPAIYKGNVYFGSRDNHLHCVSLTDGKLKWKTKIGNDMDSSPCIINDTIYVGGEDHYIYSFTADSGTVAIIDTFLYAGSSRGYLYCLSTRTGKILNKFKTGSDTDVSPVIIGDHIYIGCEGGILYSLERSTMSVLWKYRKKGRIG